MRVDGLDVDDAFTSDSSGNGSMSPGDEQEEAGEVATAVTTVIRPLWHAKKNVHGGDTIIPAPRKQRVTHRDSLPLPTLDLSIILQPESTIGLSRLYIVDFIRSAEILPVLKQWTDLWMADSDDSKTHRTKLLMTFKPGSRPWRDKIDKIASRAAERAVNKQKETNGQFSGYMADAAVTIVKKQWDGTFRLLSFSNLASNEHYKFAIRLLLTVFDDVRNHEQGFFGILLKTELAVANVSEVREVFEKCYPIDTKHYKEPEG